MAGTRLFAQSILVITTLLALLIGLILTDIHRYFIRFNDTTLTFLGSDIFRGIDIIPPHAEHDAISSSIGCNHQIHDHGSRIIPVDGGERALWVDSERPQASWVLQHSPGSARHMLNNLFKHTLEMNGCSETSCQLDSDVYSPGFRTLQVDVVLAAEISPPPLAVRQIEEAMFTLMDGLRVFDDLFAVTIDLRVVNNVQWSQFSQAENGHDHGHGTASAGPRSVRVLTTDAFAAMGRGGKGGISIEELTHTHSSGHGEEACGVDCRRVHLIVYCPGGEGMVQLRDSSSAASSPPGLTSLLLGRDVGLSCMSSSGAGERGGEEVSMVLLDQLRTLVGGVNEPLSLTQKGATQGHRHAYVTILHDLLEGGELLLCSTNTSEAPSPPGNIGGASTAQLQQQTGRLCPLLCHWESRAVAAAAALKMYTLAVDTLQRIVQLDRRTQYYLGPTRSHTEAYESAVEAVRRAGDCKEMVQRAWREEGGGRGVSPTKAQDLLKCMLRHSSEGLRRAHRLLYDPGMVQEVREREDFLVALFLPYWLPVLVPLLVGLYVEVKRYRTKTYRL